MKKIYNISQVFTIGEFNPFVFVITAGLDLNQGKYIVNLLS